MSAAQVMCRGVSKSFGSAEALVDVDLLVEGGITSVLGPNGAGKTTLLRCLSTVLRPDAGELLVDGVDPQHEPDRIEIRRRLGFQPQNGSFAPSSRVFDVLDYIAVLKGFDADRTRKHWVFHVLDLVGLRERVGDPISSLSGGMVSRLGLAQALIGDPPLLVLDEPAAGVDPDERFRMRDLIADRRERSTVIVSTHLTDEAAMSDRVIVMAEGSVRFIGTPERLAGLAAGKTWVEAERPAQTVRASWRQADGSYRCLGDPPVGASIVDATIEDGYLTLVDPPSI